MHAACSCEQFPIGINKVFLILKTLVYPEHQPRVCMCVGIQYYEPKGQCQQAQQEVSRQEVRIISATLTCRSRLIRLT